jgi:hypothetical protein
MHTSTMCALFLVLVSFFSSSTGSSVTPYEIAPITTNMQSATDAIIADLLPASGVTQQSSVGWQRLAYITGELHVVNIYSKILVT